VTAALRPPITRQNVQTFADPPAASQRTLRMPGSLTFPPDWKSLIRLWTIARSTKNWGIRLPATTLPILCRIDFREVSRRVYSRLASYNKLRANLRHWLIYCFFEDAARIGQLKNLFL
jgi:hypothetical protein